MSIETEKTAFWNFWSKSRQTSKTFNFLKKSGFVNFPKKYKKRFKNLMVQVCGKPAKNANFKLVGKNALLPRQCLCCQTVAFFRARPFPTQWPSHASAHL